MDHIDDLLDGEDAPRGQTFERPQAMWLLADENILPSLGPAPSHEVQHALKPGALKADGVRQELGGEGDVLGAETVTLHLVDLLAFFDDALGDGNRREVAGHVALDEAAGLGHLGVGAVFGDRLRRDAGSDQLA